MSTCEKGKPVGKTDEHCIPIFPIHKNEKNGLADVPRGGGARRGGDKRFALGGLNASGGEEAQGSGSKAQSLSVWWRVTCDRTPAEKGRDGRKALADPPVWQRLTGFSSADEPCRCRARGAPQRPCPPPHPSRRLAASATL